MDRIKKAVQAIERHSLKLGFPKIKIRILRDSNHITALISNGIIVRVLVTQNETARKRMRREISISQFLQKQKAPATRPITKFPPGPYKVNGCFLSYWQYEKEIAGQIDRKAAIKVLAKCHQSLRFYKGKLPHLKAEFENCYRTLLKKSTKNNLKKKDYIFLKKIYLDLIQKFEKLSYRPQPLHGDCHFGNVMKTRKGYLWTDFEATCKGPVEWDLSSLPMDLKHLYSFNHENYRLCKLLRSWTVAVWCWAAYDRSQEKREAANYHLNWLKKRFR